MLRLKRVELQGFKSFCDRTELRFHGEGIAAIVGPNGCGKSNLADAINWVLGEQSAKSLRGARMEDVIFAGTRERKSVGMAQVNLTLVDPEAHRIQTHGSIADARGGNGHGKGHTNGQSALAGANGTKGTNGHASLHASPDLAGAVAAAKGDGKALKPEEITISRRLFRSGESEYLINGKLARLRDIQDLFLGTGLGPESYAIIEQGRIGQILSSKPQDRRSVIEEAAGITKFKTRRRLAEAKLESAKQNLTRVFDILEEVGRQVNSLKRQAAKAQRYEELQADLVKHLRRLLTARFRMLERDTAKVAIELNQAGSVLEERTAALAALEQEHSRLQAAVFAMDEQLRAARQQLADTQLEFERTSSRLENQAKQIAGMEQRLAAGETESAALDTRIAQCEQEARAQEEALKEIEAGAAAARGRLLEKLEERDRLQKEVKERELTIDAARQQVLRLMGESAALRNQLAQIGSYLESLERDQQRTAQEEVEAAGSLEKLTQAESEVGAQYAAARAELETIAANRARLEEQLHRTRGEVQETRRILDALRTGYSQSKARRDSLDEILSHHAYTTESVKQLFTAMEAGQADGFHAHGVLADFVEVEPAFEKAVEEFLHDELEYVVVESWQQAERGVELLRTDLHGRATFYVNLDPNGQFTGNGILPAVGPETGIVSRLTDVLRFTNGLARDAMKGLSRVSRCFMVDDRGTAQRLALQYPTAFFLTPDGVAFHGQSVSGGRKSSAGPLALKRELRELSGAVGQLEARLEESGRNLEGLEAAAQSLTQELEQVRAAQQDREKAAVTLELEVRKIEEERRRVQSRLQVARLELSRLAAEAERAARKRVEYTAAVEEKEGARREHEERTTHAREEWNRLTEAAARAGEEHAALRVELAELEERARAERAVRTRLEGQLREFVHRRRHLGEELERMGVERAGLLANNIDLDQKAAALSEQLSKAQEVAANLVSEETGLRTALTEADEQLRLARAGVQEAREAKSQVEMEMVKRRSDLHYLDESCRRELNVPLETLAAGEQLEADEIFLAESEEAYGHVKRKIEALGPVNPQALEEYQEAQQRFDFLNTQRQDLLDSIRDTEKAIKEIDTETRRKFTDAFTAVNANFREMFKTLFGGGIGEMRLTDETNIADSGIDIVASPPGKRLQNVLLLSGGEKALTALALLMAVFQFQPSPFCILDEVDAPLDEPNIERLMRLLKEMSRQTQFVLITHSKRTMETAQILYGVTMQEPGVSKLVSVKFHPLLPATADSGMTATAVA